CVHCMASGLPTPVSHKLQEKLAERDAEIERLRADSRRHLQQLESAEAALIKAGIKMGDRQGALLSVTEGIEELAREIERLRGENEHLRRGAPLGPIIGANTIVEQEIELKRLRTQLENLHYRKDK